MKIIFFSDTHLTNKLEDKKFTFLEKIISQADKVIILGDFWDNSLITFDQFVNSSWNKLFPLLKSKKTVYVYGNHDKKEFSDKRVLLFSDTQTDKYSFKVNEKTFVAEHGDRFFKNNLIYQLTYGGPLKIFFMSKLFITWQFVIFENLLTKAFGTRFLKKKSLRFNGHIKKVIIKEFKNNEILICGHTHAAEIDLKNNFINTGIIRHGLGQFVIIDDGIIYLKEEWYNASR
nr:metallophosphoesterase family protein [Candidatus Levybacteria bacterium]